MTNFSMEVKFTKGGDLLKKLPAMFKAFMDNKKLLYASWGKIGMYMIKHAKDGVSRGRLVQTFRKLGFDLSRYITNTERLPKSKPINKDEVSKGLREFVLPNGNRIKLTAFIDDPARMFADILNDREAPIKDLLLQQFKAAGLKPEGGTSGLNK